MLNLLIMPIYNRKIKIDEPLQIGFDKKYGVERIFWKDANDIYFNQNDSKYKKIGTLFLDYLSDSISELYVEFIKDVLAMKTLEEIEKIEDKYINAYTFYFKHFFEAYLNDIANIITSKDLIPDSLIEEIGKELKNIENVKTVKKLINEYARAYSNTIRGSKIRRGDRTYNNSSNNTTKLIKALINKKNGTGIKEITIFFLEMCFLKQLYKLLIEYCFFNENTIDVKKKTNNVNLRYLYFREEFEKLKSNNNLDFLPVHSLAFFLPPAIASVNEKEGIMYTYLIDEYEKIRLDLAEDLIKESFDNTSINKGIKEYIAEDSKKNANKLSYTNTFFRISLLHLLESNKKISKCKNCGRYFVLKKEGTLYCSNPSPQKMNRTCSDYMKEYNYKNNANKSKEKLEIQKEVKRAKDRLYSNIKQFKDLKSENGKKYYNKEKERLNKDINMKKEEYFSGKITFKEFLNWLKKQ